MKIAIAKEHRDFFKKNGWIELENLLTEQQFVLLNEGVERVLSHRLAIPTDKLDLASEEALFMQGRDLWRGDEGLRQLICLPRIGEIISELVETKPVRLGYDQFIPGLHKKIAFSPAKKISQFVKRCMHLDDSSCIKGILAGVIVSLNDSAESVEPSESDIFPPRAGRVVVVHPQHLINYENLLQHTRQKYFMVVYAKGSSTYYQQSNDLHGHQLRNEGYIYYDKLSDKLNPIIYR